jgi:catechol 2,3-dioxygenase-like lactoylglutathione lyase family enzyme
MSQHLGLVALVVPDYDEALAFYVGRLGFELVEDTDLGDGKRWVVVRPPGQPRTALLLARAVNERQAAAIGNQTGGRVFLFLYTDDFDRDHAAFLARGVEFEGPPRREAYGVVAVLFDPFGNRWDLIEPNADHVASWATDRGGRQDRP